MVAQVSPLATRRALLAGSAATAVLLLPGCQTLERINLVEAIRRLLLLSATRAFAMLTAPGGFWDRSVTRLALPDLFDRRGAVLERILTSALVKERLQREFNHVAEDGARRAAPVVADAVQIIGVQNALAILRGGPSAATEMLRGQMGQRLVDVMVPALGDGLRVARDPVVAQALGALTGVDLAGVASRFAVDVDNAIWGEIGRQEGAIRADPASTNDPLLIAAFKLL
ncbi:MAG: hypothetical protein RL702_454 [Pseudomonadota bacterium]|jgi:hypothetical protein|nr:DUF4197 domain-containing protein [Novosphingobium sp.]HOA48771.1 DUF4197 domain-containing protein [Novosphingobium sp.]HPB21039.1 DUF4197 domain-containing protein [Novosphingobium sp.]HPZ48132.1 DUF4197 domain-containing protein [Novosphingobium sp.]HQE00658.1 DUF4197 domain-containing protein [Novosphingobium sp.]